MAESAGGEGREGGYNGFGVKDDVVEYKLMSGHLFDRLITQYILSGRDIEEDVEGEGGGGGEGGSNSDYESVNITGMGMGTDRGGRGGMGGRGGGGGRGGTGGRGGSGPYMSRDYPTSDSSSTSTSTGTIGNGSPSGSVAAVDVGTARVSVLYMLVALNMALRTGAEERIETLFKTAQHLSAGRNDPHNPGSSRDTDSIGFPHSESQGTGTGMGAGVRSGDGMNEGYSVQNSVEMAEGIEEEGEKEGEAEGSKIGGKALGKSRVALKKIGKAEEVEKEAEKEEYVDLAVVNEVVQHLMNSWQVR